MCKAVHTCERPLKTIEKISKFVDQCVIVGCIVCGEPKNLVANI